MNGRPNAAALAFALVAPLASPAQAQQSVLPITPGTWAEDHEQCGGVGQIWVYDGKHAGYVGYHSNPRMGREPFAELKGLSAVRQLRNGYTEYKPEDFGELGRMLVKPIGIDRISLILRAPTNSQGMQESEDKLKRCSFESLSPRMKIAIQRFAPSIATVGAAVRSAGPANGTAPRWQVAPSRNGASATAFVEGPPAMNAIGLRCQPDGGVLIFASAPGQPMNRPLLATFLSPVSSASVDATLAFDPQSKLFRGRAGSALVGVLAGEDAVLDLQLNRKSIGQVSMLGSSAALRGALGPCLGIAAAAQPAAAGTTATPLPPLGIAAGFYVDEGTPCTDPIEAFYYDGKRAGVIFAEGGLPPDPIGRVRKQGGDYELPNAGILLKVLGPTRIQLTIQDTEGPKRLCALDQVPQSLRRLVR